MYKILALSGLFLAVPTAANMTDGTLINSKGIRLAKSIAALRTPPVRTDGADLTQSNSASVELEPIASGVDIEKYLLPASGTGTIPPTSAPPEPGAFRIGCAPSHNAYDDPIVYPGQPGKSHLHTFFGNTQADANSTYASLRTAGDSTCNNILNRSAYWIAAMMHPSGKVVMPDLLVVYYKRIPATDPECQLATQRCVQLPRGLRYIFGYNMLNPAKSDPAQLRWWNCDGPGAVPGHYATIVEAVKHCPVGDRLIGLVIAPSCWNGKELDSVDHRSHMAFTRYENGRERCPKTHPYLLPQFTLAAWYTTDVTAKNWRLASDDMPGKGAMEAGSTLHADWFGAWEDKILTLWSANCIDKRLSCNSGDLGNGQQLTTYQGFDFPNGRPMLDPPARIIR